MIAPPRGGLEVQIPSIIAVTAALARKERFRAEATEQTFARLAPLVEGSRFRVAVDVDLAEDGRGRRWLRGTVAGPLRLACRRCDQAFGWPLDLALNLRLVTSEAEEQEALKDSDPVLIEHDRLPLAQVLEDELLLALPMLPRCPACDNAAGAEPAPARSSRDNPFAALKRGVQV